jgi:hypothetical protein
MTTRRAATPAGVLIYGLLGVIPFVAPALAGLAFPAFKATAGLLLALYAGLILSFLGGARWGFANTVATPRFTVVSLSMLPTLVALALLALPAEARRLQLFGLAAALALHWLWDIGSDGLPGWYARLRSLLTAGAVAGLLAGAIVLA